jgi:hypothetical protein
VKSGKRAVVGCDVQQYVVHNLGFLLASEIVLFWGAVFNIQLQLSLDGDASFICKLRSRLIIELGSFLKRIHHV